MARTTETINMIYRAQSKNLCLWKIIEHKGKIIGETKKKQPKWIRQTVELRSFNYKAIQWQGQKTCSLRIRKTYIRSVSVHKARLSVQTEKS